jgi:hypothetical protein
MQVLRPNFLVRRTVPLLNTHKHTRRKRKPVQADTGVIHCGSNILQFILLIAAIERMLAAFGDNPVGVKLNQCRGVRPGQMRAVSAPLPCKVRMLECQELLEADICASTRCSVARSSGFTRCRQRDENQHCGRCRDEPGCWFDEASGNSRKVHVKWRACEARGRVASRSVAKYPLY